MHTSIILIGPYLCGKTALRLLLAEGFRLPHCSLNPAENWELCMRYYREAGYDEEEDRRILDAQGFEGLYRYMKPFEAHAVVRCLADHPGHVVEIGATHSVYEDEGLFRRVADALESHPNIFLLLPSPDRNRSYRVLRERYSALLGVDMNRHFVMHHANHDLATHTVYTEGRTPEETRDEIVRLIGPEGPPPEPIILIGPPGAGKSTVGRLLAARLGLPQVSMDALRWAYYAEMGYDTELAGEIRERLGFRGLYRYWKPFEAYAVERILAAHRRGILDFGAGHSVFEDNALFARVRRALEPYRYVILLLPSPDLDESVRILEERSRTTIGGVDANRHMIDHHSNRDLAKAVIYTEGKTPFETREEIVDRMTRRLPA